MTQPFNVRAFRASQLQPSVPQPYSRYANTPQIYDQTYGDVRQALTLRRTKLRAESSFLALGLLALAIGYMATTGGALDILPLAFV